MKKKFMYLLILFLFALGLTLLIPTFSSAFEIDKNGSTISLPDLPDSKGLGYYVVGSPQANPNDIYLYYSEFPLLVISKGSVYYTVGFNDNDFKYYAMSYRLVDGIWKINVDKTIYHGYYTHIMKDCFYFLNYDLYDTNNNLLIESNSSDLRLTLDYSINSAKTIGTISTKNYSNSCNYKLFYSTRSSDMSNLTELAKRWGSRSLL